MDSFKQKYETPIGYLTYCFLWGNGKLKLKGDEQNPLDYEYSCNLDLSTNNEDEELNVFNAKIKSQIQADLDEFWAKAKEAGVVKKAKPSWTPIKFKKDEEDRDIEDTAWFNAKTVANWKDKKSGDIRNQVIQIYDGIGNKIRDKLINANIYIGNGSKGIIYCTLTITHNEDTGKSGITAYLEAVQLAKLVKHKAGEIDEKRLTKIADAEAIDLDEEVSDVQDTTYTPAEVPDAPEEAADVEV